LGYTSTKDGIRPKGRKALRPYITGLIVTKKLTNFTRFVAQSLAPLHYRINL